MFYNTQCSSVTNIFGFFLKLFACLFLLHTGTFHEFLVEHEVIEHALNDASYSDEVVLKKFIISENTTLLYQGKISGKVSE